MVAKNQRIFSVAILILVFGSSVLPLPVFAATKYAKSTRWQPHFLQRQHGRSRSAGTHLYASSSAVHGTAQGRSADVSTGRDLFKKFQMFKSLYQQPQNNITVVTQTAAPTTTTVTSPATTTTTATTPTNTNTNTATTTRMATLPTGAGAILQARININGAGTGDGSVPGIAETENFRRQQRPLNRRRLGVKKNGNFNVLPIRRKPQVVGGGNGFGQQPNRKRVRIITKRFQNKKNKNGGNNNKNIINNNKNKNNSNNNPNPNRFQNIMNAFRLQTPVVYNY